MIDTHLEECGFISKEQKREIRLFATEKNISVLEAIMELNIASEENLIKKVCECEGMEFIDADNLNFKLNASVTAEIGQITELSSVKAFAVDSPKGRLFLLKDPEDGITTEIRSRYGQNAAFALSSEQTFKNLYMRILQPEFIIRQADKVAVENAKNRNLRTDISHSSDAGRLYRQLMECAINERASDLQIIPLAENKAAIDMRVDGKNSRYAIIPKSTAETIRNILVNQAGIAGAMHPGKPIEGKMKYEKSDVRINMIPSKQGTDINIRFLSNHILTFDELGMSPEGIALFRRLINMTKGLVLIVGPTGSGKSTTMYAGLSEIVGNGRKICTVEDPVEIALPGATQIDVTANLSYEEAVKSILRHDVDIAVIGEIRDAAVADIVAREADTGHLILSTLHTNDAISAVSRLIHLGVDPYIIGDILAAVSAQRLVRRICPFCKTECSISELGENVVHTFSLSQSDAPFYKGKGCPHCKGSGYLGRIVINEILIADKQIRSAIQRKADRSEIESLALRNGFMCMADDGIAKVRAGITTYEEILPLKNDII